MKNDEDNYFEEPVPMEFTKEEIEKKEKTIFNLKNILDLGFRKLDENKCKNLTLVLGGTGCGKSTMLSSMIVGAQNLEHTKIEYWVEIKQRGQIVKKPKYRWVIDYKKDAKKIFTIGHSLSKSETFFPGFYEDPINKGSYYVDVAGLEDTAGPMIEYVN